MSNALAEMNFVFVGGSSGMGLATAELALAQGATVTIAGRSRQKLDAAAARLDAEGRLSTAVVDMTDEAAVRTFARSFDAASVDALIVSASSVSHGAFPSSATDDIRSMFEAKFIGPYVVAREMLPALRSPGSITLFSGVLSRKPGSAAAGLAAVNAAVEGLTRALAKELAPGIRVNCVSPGMTRTDAYSSMDEDRREAMFRSAAAGLPMGRIAEPSEIAEAVLFLATNSFTTGHVLDVDGGHLIA